MSSNEFFTKLLIALPKKFYNSDGQLISILKFIEKRVIKMLYIM